MADCLTCTDNLTIEDIIRLVTVCDNGSFAFRIKEVSYSDSCFDCTGSYKSIEDLLRNALYCDENGVYYIQVVTLL